MQLIMINANANLELKFFIAQQRWEAFGLELLISERTFGLYLSSGNTENSLNRPSIDRSSQSCKSGGWRSELCGIMVYIAHTVRCLESRMGSNLI
jgi:hypothetical protein